MVACKDEDGAEEVKTLVLLPKLLVVLETAGEETHAVALFRDNARTRAATENLMV